MEYDIIIPQGDEYDIIIPHEENYYNADTYKKSNALAQAMYSMEPLSNKVFAIGLSKMEREGDQITAVMSTTELRRLLKKTNGSFYDQLVKCSHDIKKHDIVYEGFDDSGEKSFQISSIVTDCTFANGIFKIYFNSKLEKELFARKNFTTYLLQTNLSLKQKYSFRIYEVLKMKYDHDIALFKKDLPVTAIYNLIQFKFTIGFYKETTKTAEEIKKRKKSFEEIEKLLPEEELKLQQWSDFKKVVLTPALKEIREKTAHNITMRPIRTGKGGKITSVEFTIERKKINSNNTNKSGSKQNENNETNGPANELDLIAQVEEFITEPIKVKDIRSILKEANYDIERVNKAYKLSEKQGHIDKLVPWLIAAIKNNYQENTIGKDNTSAKTNGTKFNNFQDRYSDMGNQDKERYFELMNKKYDKIGGGLTPEEENEFRELERKKVPSGNF